MTDIFYREKITETEEIIRWWNKGRKWLNISFICFVIIHLAILNFILHNYWTFFLLPIIFFIGALINLVFSFGLFFELFMIRFLKRKINFDKISPIVKFVTCWVILFALIVLSIHNIVDFS